MIKISKVKPQEILKVKELLSYTWKDTYGKYFPEDAIKKITDKWHDPKMLGSQLKDTSIYFAKALDEKEDIVGIITLRKVDDEILFLNRLYVHPNTQGKGIGSQLLKAAIDFFSSVKKLRVECEKQNNKACAFYVKKGFKIVGEKDEMVEGITMKRVMMEKDIK